MKPRGALLCAALLLTGCQSAPAADPNKVQVVTTVNIITDLAEQIGGERVQVYGLMGEGVDPHLYNASAGDVRRLSEAEVLHGLEKRPQVHVSAVMEDIPQSSLLHADGAVDPHAWFDPTLWKYAARSAADTLIAADPAGESKYQNNLRRYLAELDELDRWSQAQLSPIPPERRVLVTAHDAFGYFARHYDFEVRGVQGISTVAEAGGASVSALAEEMTRRQIPAVFVENTVSPRTVEAVQAAAAARGWTVERGGELFGDAAGEARTAEGTYTGMLRHNVITIREALQ